MQYSLHGRAVQTLGLDSLSYQDLSNSVKKRKQTIQMFHLTQYQTCLTVFICYPVHFMLIASCFMACNHSSSSHSTNMHPRHGLFLCTGAQMDFQRTSGTCRRCVCWRWGGQEGLQSLCTCRSMFCTSATSTRSRMACCSSSGACRTSSVSFRRAARAIVLAHALVQPIPRVPCHISSCLISHVLVHTVVDYNTHTFPFSFYATRAHTAEVG